MENVHLSIHATSLASHTHLIHKQFLSGNGSGTPAIHSHFQWYKMYQNNREWVGFMQWFIQEQERPKAPIQINRVPESKTALNTLIPAVLGYGGSGMLWA